MRSKKQKRAKSSAHTSKSISGKDISSLPRDLCKSVLLTLAMGAILIFVTSLLLSFTADPLRWAAPLGVAVSAVTAFLGGVAAIRLHGQSALLCGLCNGSICLVLLLLMSLGFREYTSQSSPVLSLLLHLGFPLVSVAGAYAGRPSPKRPRKKRKHS